VKHHQRGFHEQLHLSATSAITHHLQCEHARYWPYDSTVKYSTGTPPETHLLGGFISAMFELRTKKIVRPSRAAQLEIIFNVADL
jgi:hypothetical protein